MGVGLFQRFGSNGLDRTHLFECLSLWLRWKSWLPHACLSQAPPTNQVKIMAQGPWSYTDIKMKIKRTKELSKLEKVP